MIYLKTDEEIELLRENNILVSETLAEVGRHIRPGVTTKELDSIAEDFIRAHGAVPAFLGYQGFPASLCISVNEQVVHGIPSSKCVLKEGDIVSVDCGTFMRGLLVIRHIRLPLARLPGKLGSYGRHQRGSL